MAEKRRPEEVVVEELAQQLGRAGEELTEQIGRTATVLTGGIDEAAERALERRQSDDPLTAQLRAELGAPPLAQPERFAEAHRRVMRSLEVLDRDGHREAVVRGFGPLSGVGEAAVGFVARFIIRSYTKGLVQELAGLYARREAQCTGDDPSRKLLVGRRAELERLQREFEGGGVGAPLLLAVGAAAPVVASGARYLGGVRVEAWLAVAVVAALFVLMVLLSGTMLGGAVVARRRTRALIREPLTELWGTVGAAGDLPEDASKRFAVVSVLLIPVAFVVLPAVGALVFIVL